MSDNWTHRGLLAMALALCDTVWKDCTFVEDFAAIALYQNDRAARYLAAVKIREVEEFFVPGNTWRAVDFMLENYRVTAGDLLHFAEYIALNFPLLQSNPRHPYRKAGEPLYDEVESHLQKLRYDRFLLYFRRGSFLRIYFFRFFGRNAVFFFIR